MVADEAVDLGIALQHGRRAEISRPLYGVKAFWLEDLAGQADAGAKIPPVVRMRHVVEPMTGGIRRIGRAQLARNPRDFERIGPDMDLEAVARRRRLAVIADGDGQEVILRYRDIRRRRGSG